MPKFSYIADVAQAIWTVFNGYVAFISGLMAIEWTIAFLKKSCSVDNYAPENLAVTRFVIIAAP